MKKICTIAILVATLYSCAKKMTPTAKPTPTEVVNELTVKKTTEAPVIAVVTEPAAKAAEKVEPTTVAYGKEVFKAKCGKCHDLPVAENFTAAKWVKIVDWMAPKAKLDQNEKEKVLAYVSYYAKTAG